MTRLQVFEKELENLENQMVEIETNFGKAAAPVELEQRIIELRNQVNQLNEEENRKGRFLDFCEKVCLKAGLDKVTTGEFRKKELYDDEIAIKYDEDHDPDDEFRLCICTTADYSIGELSIRYKRTHAEEKVVESKQRVLFKLGYRHFAFNDKAFSEMLVFIRANADEAVSYLREAEYRWTVNQIRSVFAQKGITETEWTPAESELNLG